MPKVVAQCSNKICTFRFRKKGGGSGNKQGGWQVNGLVKKGMHMQRSEKTGVKNFTQK